MKRQKILLLGATGAIGKNLITSLSEEMYEIYCTTRQKRESSSIVKYLQGNAKDKAFLSQLMTEEWDVIVNFMTYSKDEFDKVVDLVLANSSHYIHLSSARVYSENKNAITEDSDRLFDLIVDKSFLDRNEYFLNKAREENLLQNSEYKNWTIVRPYISYSQDKFQLGNYEKEEWLYRALSGRSIILNVDILNKSTTITQGSDVAKGIAALCGEDKCFGECFNIMCSKTVTWGEVLEVYLDILRRCLGIKAKVVLVDLSDYKKLKKGADKFQLDFDRLYNRRFSTEKINHYVSVSNFVLPDEGLSDCLSAFLLNPSFSKINWALEGEKDRLSGELANLLSIPSVKGILRYLYYRYIKR